MFRVNVLAFIIILTEGIPISGCNTTTSPITQGGTALSSILRCVSLWEAVQNLMNDWSVNIVICAGYLVIRNLNIIDLLLS